MGRVQLADVSYYDSHNNDFYDTIDDFIRCLDEDEDEEDERVAELEEVVSGYRYWMDYRDVDFYLWTEKNG